MRPAHRILFAIMAAAALAGCRADAADDWSQIGPGTTSFRQADRTCEDQLAFVAEESARSDFYVKCMAALGWAPRPGAVLDT